MGNLATCSFYLVLSCQNWPKSSFVIKVSTLVFEATKIDHAFELNCTPYRLYHIGSNMAKMLLKQN